VGVARAWSVALLGVEGRLVEVEADLASGLPGFYLVGLPDTALTEARDRVRSAVVNSGEPWPNRRLTVSLSPADMHKRGSAFDLALAGAVLAVAGMVPRDALSAVVLLGELGLDGRVRPVRGVLPAVAAAARAGLRHIVVPEANAGEAALVSDVSVLGIRSLRQLVAVLRGLPVPDELPPGTASTESSAGGGSAADPPDAPAEELVLRAGLGRLDMTDVRGQIEARKALEVCAAGGHNLYLHGVPGAGKTMLAERLPGLLPPLEGDSALEVTAIHSVAGTLPADSPLVTTPPFCNPHHTASVAAIVGGGSGELRPGAVSLAHRGVLFIDEAPEFRSGVLDALRQPLESGVAVIARSGVTTRFPARFMLVLAANPCPCGRADTRDGSCECSPMNRRRYLTRLSGPLLDRIDVQVMVDRVGKAQLLARETPEGSREVAERVLEARDRAARRYAGMPWRLNAELPGRELRRRFRPRPGALRAVEQALDLGTLSARGVDRVLRVACGPATLPQLMAIGRSSSCMSSYLTSSGSREIKICEHHARAHPPSLMQVAAARLGSNALRQHGREPSRRRPTPPMTGRPMKCIGMRGAASLSGVWGQELVTLTRAHRSRS
jgi:magnesium chelatase family protein